MASHFSTIGLAIDSEEALFDLAQQIGPEAEAIETPAGLYFRWQDESGAELWLQTDTSGQNFLGVNPHFQGLSQVRVGLTERISGPDYTPLDGSFQAWAEPTDNPPTSGTYPFIFDTPDFRTHDDDALPGIVTVQIAAFAYEVEFFAEEAAFHASQTGEVKFSTQSFIPIGLFHDEGSESAASATAFFTGIVRVAEERTNTLTDRTFYWALVETLGGTFDVVIDPQLLPELPSPGGVISGSFWLSGRIQTFPDV